MNQNQNDMNVPRPRPTYFPGGRPPYAPLYFPCKQRVILEKDPELDQRACEEHFDREISKRDKSLAELARLRTQRDAATQVSRKSVVIKKK